MGSRVRIDSQNAQCMEQFLAYELGSFFKSSRKLNKVLGIENRFDHHNSFPTHTPTSPRTLMIDAFLIGSHAWLVRSQKPL